MLAKSSARGAGLPHARCPVNARTRLARRTASSSPQRVTELADGGGSGDPGSGSAAAAPAEKPQRDARALVDAVLEQVRTTDGGISAPPEVSARVDALLDELEAIGAQQTPRPLDNDLLWGNYTVAYTSVARATEAQRRGQPAGGRFRSGVGRALFSTTGLFQSVLRPDVATNKVAFRLFGVLPGYVGLRGRLELVGSGGDTVKVLFDRPVLSFADCLNIRIGPPSSVQLSTTYLDERIRLGKGSRGSLFVFERTAAADAAAMDRVGLERTTPAGVLLLAAMLGAMALGGWGLFRTGAPALQLCGALVWAAAVGMAAVFWKGGIVDGGDEGTQGPQKGAAAPAPAAS
ncbi:hypothetical protein Rsub_12855 [Raphidocelis subcapitata]|uniref:Plastid lipid-associated protein/fibrillin conserved domain-containing protein n=1 Tax=Raphidocelis subcapitata TaxID=307507 RepID=A0A2V0PPL3_9CHLO|nr:hypothetical protein Rsub_12855 [Raphidocelis subcapitata]|eukprot:GBG00114.1 hypothetical protein Rsub_12855 [Raphidocelis subcapitata]